MNDKIAVIGSGMMGGAIIKSLLKAGYEGEITAVDISADRLKEFEALGVKTSLDNAKAAGDADIIFIIVKPGDVKEVLNEISEEIKGKLLISVAATVPLAFLKKNAPDAKIVRIMPNLGVLCRLHILLIVLMERLQPRTKRKLRLFFACLDVCEQVDEKYMDAITAVSGSGPGYLSIIVEALTYAGLKVGLPHHIASKCAAQTVMATGKLVIDLHESPSRIKDMTTTPGGTTIEAIYQIEQSQIRPAMIRAIEEATKKSQDIREKLNLT